MMHRDGAAAVPSARPGYPARAAASAIPAMPLSLHRWRAEDAHRRRQSGENTPSDAAARGRRQAERAPASVVSAAKSALASKAMLAISAAALQIRIRHLRRREDTD